MFPLEASGFHDGGVASCSGCHIMHDTEVGFLIDHSSPFLSPVKLRYSSVAETCLSCHAQDNGAVLSPDPLAPSVERGGGNFTFLWEDNINDAPGAMTLPISGDHAGHNVVAPGEMLDPDPDYTVSPGGSYPSAYLTCTSCHDPHGNQEFRMLRGQGSVDASGFIFLTAAPSGQGIDLYFSHESQFNHTAYNDGWSDWCANCHGSYHDAASGASFQHPSSGVMATQFVTNYNEYNGPGSIIPGDYTMAYLPDVPLEDPSYSQHTTTGASVTSEISCMTCHRAHGTSAVAAQRWDSAVRYLSDDGNNSGSYPIPDPYSSTTQRPLCVKCHVEQAVQHGSGQGCTYCH